MKLIGIEILQDLKTRYPEVIGQVDALRQEIEAANWRTPQDIKARYSSASFLHDKVVVLNIKGNRYRLAIQVSYRSGVCMVLKAGSHAEYDRWTF